MATPFTPEQYAWLLETFGTSSTREARDGRVAETTSQDDTSTQEQGPSHTATTGSGEQGSMVKPWEADVTHLFGIFASYRYRLPAIAIDWVTLVTSRNTPPIFDRNQKEK